jgi:hypothetical protein
MRDCESLNEVLAIFVAAATLLFGVSEYLGIKRPLGCASIIGYMSCRCKVQPDALVLTVSPRTSQEIPRASKKPPAEPSRASQELPRVVEEKV